MTPFHLKETRNRNRTQRI